MNVADNQAQNLNYNPHNPNLTNPGSKKFARDYDKEPIIVKYHAITLNAIVGGIIIAATLAMAISGKFSIFQILFLVFLCFNYPLNSLSKYSNLGKCYVRFKNNEIELFSAKDDLVLSSIKLSKNLTIKRTTGPSYLEIPKKAKYLCLIIISIYVFMTFFVLTVIRGEKQHFWYIFGVIISTAILPLMFYRLFNGLGLDIIHDSVIIFGETAVIEASVLTRREYFLLRGYFLTKIGKDLEKIEPEIFV